MTDEFDYIVVGGGAAGCVVAGRLAEDSAVRVLLLEEGPHDKSVFIKAPGGFFKTHGTNRTFAYLGEPEPASDGRRYPFLQGRVLGGGLSINAMVYIRGQKEDFDDWRNNGCVGWGYEDVLPYFSRSETNSRFSSPYHGTAGPLRISDGNHRHFLSGAFVRAAQEAGYSDGRAIRFNPDFNGERQEGVGFYQAFSDGGERWSTARAYLALVPGRDNLVVQTDSLVTKVVVVGNNATGVVVRSRSHERTVRAKREVILCAGAFMSPKLLMLSGIGPADHLREFGIPIVRDTANVGANYQDHVISPVDATLRRPISLMGQDRGWNAVKNGIQWLAYRTGPLASNVVECGGFFDIDGDGRPEVNLNALAVSSAGWGDPLPQGEHVFSLAPLCLTCNSRGSVRLGSSKAEAPPKVQCNFFSHEIDMRNQIAGLRLARHILKAPSLAVHIQSERLPGDDISNSDEDLAQYIRRRSTTGLHAAGTCAMGAASDSVVDLTLKVRGIRGLRVIDASVMPQVVRGNTAAATVMIAERGADLIRAEAPH